MSRLVRFASDGAPRTWSSSVVGGLVSAAPLQRSASVPVAAAPAPQGGASGGITPAAGQGFVPAQGAAAGAESAQPAPTAEQLLQVIVQQLGKEYREPIISADGTIYMEKMKPTIANGRFQLSYLKVGKLDKATGKLVPTEELLATLKKKEAAAGTSGRVLVKVGDQMVWQTFGKDEQGQPIVTKMAAATEAEIAAYQQEQQAAAAQQAGQQKLQGRADWQSKVGTVAQHLGIFGSTGQLLSGLSGGPNAYSGRPGAGWISGYMVASRLNGKAEGKLLPKWFTQGPFATALEWGIQAYGMLDMGNDIRTLRDYFGKKPPLPLADVTGGAARLVAQGHAPHLAQELAKAGEQLRIGERMQQMGQTGGFQMVQGTSNAAVLNTQLGAAQLLTKADAHAAYRAVDPSFSKGLELRGNIDSGINKGLSAMKGLIQPAMIGATALGFVSSVLGVKNLVDAKGGKVLLDTQQGRGTALGVATSGAFLGMYLLPMALGALGVANPAIGAVSAVVNIAQNVLGGVQLLNSYGLFGGDQPGKKGGFLDNDAVRAAFLIPPLSPIGAFAFWMKSRKKKQAAEVAKLEAAQKFAVQQITQQREMAKLQLQATGQIAGAVRGEDGAIAVPTSISSDMQQLAAQMGGGVPAPAGPPTAGAAPAPTGAPATPAAAPAAASGENSALADQRRQLTMTARPMR